MKVRCAICGFEADVGDGITYTTPMLAIRPNKHSYRHYPDIWVCDIHK